jgi:hypothetical protein
VNGWFLGGVAALMLAGTAGLMVQGGELKKERAQVVSLQRDLRMEKQRADAAEKLIRKIEALSATQAHETAIQCQGEGAELFNRGRQVGRAEGRAQCAVS